MTNYDAQPEYPLQEYAQAAHKDELEGLRELQVDLQDIIRLLALSSDEAELRLERIAQLGAMHRSIESFLSASA